MYKLEDIVKFEDVKIDAVQKDLDISRMVEATNTLGKITPDGYLKSRVTFHINQENEKDILWYLKENGYENNFGVVSEGYFTKISIFL